MAQHNSLDPRPKLFSVFEGESSFLPNPRRQVYVEGRPVNAAETEHSVPVTVTPVRRVAFAAHAVNDAELPHDSYWAKLRHKVGLNAPRPGTTAYTVYLTYLSFGIIYGDIGTSPLYAFSATLSIPYSEDDVIGILSCLIWALLWVVLIKYLIFILLADDHGEGGTFAMYNMISRHLMDMVPNRVTYQRANSVLATIAIIGVALVLSDGMLTPAISVISAIEGIQVAVPSLSNGVVVAISIVILLLLFIAQHFGTTRVSFIFSPIVLLWFISLAAIGINNLIQSPQVFRAMSPSYAFQFFIRTGTQGWIALGGIVLVVTGCEALYADMGHFNATSIRLSSCLVVVPALIFAYMGQAASLIVDIPNELAYFEAVSAGLPTNITPVVRNTFFYSLPSSVFYEMLVLSTFAAIIASQAIISASFSLITQATTLHFFPRLTIIHTDSRQYGQVYVPEINFLEMIGSIIIVAVAQTSSNLTSAYGVAVTSVFALTTILYTVAIVVRFKRHWFWALLFFFLFMLVDMAFLTSNLLKFLTGGWFPLALAVVITFIMSLWRWGRLNMIQRQNAMAILDEDLFKLRMAQTITSSQESNETIPPTDHPEETSSTPTDHPEGTNTTVANAAGQGSSSTSIATSIVPTVLVSNTTFFCYSSTPDKVPASFVHFLRRVAMRPSCLVFVTVTGLNVPRVRDDLFVSSVLDYDNVYRAVVNYGYMEKVPQALPLAVRIIRLVPQIATTTSLLIDVATASDYHLLSLVDPTFVMGHDSVEPHENSNIARRILVYLFEFLLTISKHASSQFGVPRDLLLEIGLRVSI